MKDIKIGFYSTQLFALAVQIRSLGRAVSRDLRKHPTDSLADGPGSESIELRSNGVGLLCGRESVFFMQTLMMKIMSCVTPSIL